MTVTEETYEILDAAYGYFNEKLWGGKLPPCAITLQRKGQTNGYFWHGVIAFKNEQNKIADEIALNPDSFKDRDTIKILSTLVHEMCHCWQTHYGKPTRNGYHNQEWANEMLRVGLRPVSESEGMTGQKVTHEIIEDGLFLQLVKEFIFVHGDKLDWYTRIVDEERKKIAKKKRASKTKYTCPECGQNAWAKPDAKLICGYCEIEMIAEQVKDDDEEDI